MANDVLSSGSECDAVLGAATVVKIHEDLNLKMAWLRIIDRSNYEKYKKDFAAFVPGYFAGSYDEFVEKRESLYQKESFEMELSYARDVLMSSVPIEAINAWSNCIAASRPGLHVWLSQVTRESAVLSVRWMPPAGLGKLRDTELAMLGGKPVKDTFSSNEAFVGQIDVLLQRNSKNEPITGIASGVVGDDGVWSTNFYVPALSETHEHPIDFHNDWGAAHRISFATPSWSGPADVEVAVSVASAWEASGDPWIQLTVWLDSSPQPIYWSGEVGVPTNQTKTLSTTLKLHVPAGKSNVITMQHDNRRAKALSMKLAMQGKYTSSEWSAPTASAPSKVRPMLKD